jgi:hypothetical protein
MTRSYDVIKDFWEWHNRRAQRQDNGVADLALDKCEETFRRCDWHRFGYWYEVYCRERGRTATSKSPDTSTTLEVPNEPFQHRVLDGLGRFGSRQPLH